MKSEKKEAIPVPLKRGPDGIFFASYPVFALVSDGQGLLITGGGGGGKAYGVINYLQAHVVIQTPTSLTVETIATLDTGVDAPTALDYLNTQGGVWICAMGCHSMLFRFNDDSLTIEPLFRWRTELGNERHLTNFAKIFSNPQNGHLHALTGGEDKTARLWLLTQEAGVGTRVTQAVLMAELPEHQAEVVSCDVFGSEFLTTGKDGTVKLWSISNQSLITSITPRSPDKKLADQVLSIRAAYLIGNNNVVILCHHHRGPAFLMLYSAANPAAPLAAVQVTKAITPSIGISASRDKVVVSHMEGEKSIYLVPSLRLVNRTTKKPHQMPPGKTAFVFDQLAVSGSPDFCLHFYEPNKTAGKSACAWILIFILLLLVLAAAIFFLVPEGRAVMVQHVPVLQQIADLRASEL